MSDYLFMLENHLDPARNHALRKVQELATAAGMNVWLTGGAMRDMLRGAPIRDLDFTVERDAVKLGKALAQALEGEVVEEDALKRGVELRLPEGVTVSVSNARTEKYAKTGSKPQIAPATIHADLARRDFTINAIALSLGRGSRGLLVDPCNGQADLANRELRTTNPYVFLDDPTRLGRMIRFQHVLGMTVLPRTQSQFENALLEGLHENVTAGALASEIRASATDPNAVAVMEGLDAHGLLKPLSAALTGARLNAAGLAKLEKAAQEVLPAGHAGGWLAFLSILTEKLNARDRAQVVRSFALNAEETAVWKKLDGQASALESALRASRVNRPSQVWDLLQGAPEDEILMVLYRSGARTVEERVRAYYEKYLPLAQEVTDESVRQAGGKTGTPKYEKVRRALIAAKLNARPKKVEALEPEPDSAVAGGQRPGARLAERGGAG